MADNEYEQPETVEAVPDASEGLVKLGSILMGRFSVYKKDRAPAEEQWLKNLRQYLGQYDPDYESSLAPETSRAYPKRTRVKCVSMVSRLMSLLFPAGERNWSLTASAVPSVPAETLIEALNEWRRQNPEVAPTQSILDQLVLDVAKASAEAQQKAIEDQLKDVNPYDSCDYETLVRRVVHSAVLYGPGVVKGPMVISDRMSRFKLDEQGVVQVVEVDALRPYFEFVPCWNYYPDMSASSFEQMEGEFQRHVYSRAQLLQLAEREDFDGDLIRVLVDNNPEGNYERYNYENLLQTLGGQAATAVKETSKFELIEYWGSAPAKLLRKAGLDIAEDVRGEVRYNAWLLCGRIVKLGENPFPFGTKVYHQFVFEEDEVNLMGSG